MILTDEEIYAAMTPDAVEGEYYLPFQFARAIEAAILAKIGEPVACMDTNVLGGIFFTSYSKSRGVPLYQLPEVKE